MGVFKKLKDVLFDIEEEEIPVITKEEKKPVLEENPIKEIKIPKDEIDEIPKKVEPIKEIKNESKFNFPLDFDEEIPVRKKRDYFDEDDDFITSRSNLRENRDSYYKEEPVKNKKDSYDYSRLNINDSKPKNNSKPFKISPIISPVYGILDQNYTKDDVIVRSEVNKKGPNLDDVRKKAYGSKKKEEIKKEEDEFEEPLRTLDEILIENDVKEEKPKIKNDVIQEPPVYDDELPDEPYADEVEDNSKEESIESDLFNLIDSMYEERNEREEEE